LVPGQREGRASGSHLNAMLRERHLSRVLVAVGIGLTFVGWLISVHLAGWLDAVGAAFGRFAAFVPGVAHVAVWLMPLVAGVVLVVILGLRVWFPRRASEVLVKLLSLEEERPRIRRAWRRGACWRLAWKMPLGVTSEKVLEQRTAVEQTLDCSLRACWYERGLVRAEFGVARLPQRVAWRDFRRTWNGALRAWSCRSCWGRAGSGRW
jgi:hypothetical protein